jgi:Xaa-Pro aminopeptidase
MYKEKMSQAVQILQEQNVDLWLTFVRESSAVPDPVMDLLVGGGVVWPAAFLITRTGQSIALIGSIDANGLIGHIPFEVKSYKTSIKDSLLEFLRETDPASIAINYSTNDVMADGLTHGMYLSLCEYLQGTPWLSRLQTSEKIVAALRGRKSATEIARLKAAIHETLDIFNKVSTYLKPGLSEQDVAAFVNSQVAEKGLTTAWSPDHCPAVYTGPDTAGTHAGPTTRKIERGHILNMDFGVRKDGYVADLQRTWYVLRDGEKQAPAEVQRGFDTIRQAVHKAAAAVRPGVEGWMVDDVARQIIVQAGYEEYPHALGHQVGRSAHDGAGLLSPKWERYKNLPYLKIEKDQIYTIEPRLTVAGHGVVTIEEMIVVTENGCEFLSEPQMELICIK